MADVPEPKSVAQKQGGGGDDSSARARAKPAQGAQVALPKAAAEKRALGGTGGLSASVPLVAQPTLSKLPVPPPSAGGASSLVSLEPLHAPEAAKAPKPAQAAPVPKLERMPVEDIFVAPPRPRRRRVHRASQYMELAARQRLGVLTRLWVWLLGAVVVVLLGASLAKVFDRFAPSVLDSASQRSASD